MKINHNTRPRCYYCQGFIRYTDIGRLSRCFNCGKAFFRYRSVPLTDREPQEWWNGVHWCNTTVTPMRPLLEPTLSSWLRFIGEKMPEKEIPKVAAKLKPIQEDHFKEMQQQVTRILLPRKETEMEGSIKMYEGTPRTQDHQVWIGRDAWADMCSIVQECDIEASWLGFVEETPFGPYVKEVVFPKQICSGGGTSLDSQDLSRIFMELHRSKNAVPILFHGHSHVNMSAIFSGIDRPKMAEWGGECKKNDADWFICLVMNKARQLQCTVEFFKPIRYSAEINVYLGDPRRHSSFWAHEIKEKVTRGAVNHRFNRNLVASQSA